MSESLSAKIGENLRLKILCTLRLGAKNFVEYRPVEHSNEEILQGLDKKRDPLAATNACAAQTISRSPPPELIE